MENLKVLTGSQLTELRRQAVEAVKGKRLKFFNEPGIVENFPWLTRKVAIQEEATGRKRWWGLAIFGGGIFAVVGIMGVDAVAGVPEQTGLAAAAGVCSVAALFRMALLDSPISDAYCKTVGWERRERTREERRKVEMIQLDRWIAGEQKTS